MNNLWLPLASALYPRSPALWVIRSLVLGEASRSERAQQGVRGREDFERSVDCPTVREVYYEG